MAREEIQMEDLVLALDAEKSDYADFFRLMLGHEDLVKLYLGIVDDDEKYLTEIETETKFEFPGDLLSLYLCTNGGNFADLVLYPLASDGNEPSIDKYNAVDKSFKLSKGIDETVLLIGEYPGVNQYVTCFLNDEHIYVYQLWDGEKKKPILSYDYIVQLIALEMNYAIEEQEGE